MDLQLQSWGAVAGILALLVVILSLLRDVFNFQLEWATSSNLLKRLAANRWIQRLVFVALIGFVYWLQYNKIQSLESINAEQEIELIAAYATQTVETAFLIGAQATQTVQAEAVIGAQATQTVQAKAIIEVQTTQTAQADTISAFETTIATQATELASAHSTITQLQADLDSMRISIANNIPSFGEMRFCKNDDLLVDERHCKTSQEKFTEKEEIINVSWTYGNVYEGMKFSRMWYWNDMLILAVDDVWEGDWKTDGVSEYTFLRAEGVQALGNPLYFPPGRYTVELYIGDKLEQSGNFIVE